ncbi:MAG: DJ-1/PfpI family protein [Clostridia bacterium]|nr:DJ-1/PfpI family protein [Clostridia bacterium]
MSKVYAFLAPGLEEVECLGVVDILRRAGIDTQLVSITDDPVIVGSHGIKIVADSTFANTSFSDYDVLFLPGGMPGTANLAGHSPLAALLKDARAKGKRLAAICAAPSVLGDLGLLEGHKATCYPGWESHLKGATHVSLSVVTDGQITTAKGLGCAIDLGIELVSLLVSPEKALEIKKSIQHPAEENLA